MGITPVVQLQSKLVEVAHALSGVVLPLFSYPCSHVVAYGGPPSGVDYDDVGSYSVLRV